MQQGKNLEGETALIGLKLLSGSMAFLLMAFLLWRAGSYLLTKSTWTSISIPKLVGALLLLLINALIMFKGINWDTGFKGPPLLNFMTAQTLALPLKPIVAHFIGLGPAVLVVLATILFKSTSCRSIISLEIIFISFTPLLIFGAESRQWIGILPVVICLLGVYNWTTAQRVWCLIASALIVAPALLLKSQVTLATTQSLSFQSTAWQYYFNRQGPWMSVYSYEIALIALAIFIIVFIYLPSITKTLKAVGNSPS
ncbi:hypothetical protein [Pseudomonas huanghezhanensis]|uniref:hypothetical protein n=1 Tax=Pseudomonas huanghezhanensis TaxID=3002903 RepID=UPI002286578D|nr:hypothetical protein [Pseudomonas sp. BSw22131]